MQVDLSKYESRISTRNKVGRALWGLVEVLLFRPSLRSLYGWRRFLLRVCGAQVGRGALVDPGVRIWAPWNVEIGDHAWIGHDVDLYSVDKIIIASHSIVSQYAFLCAATRDITDPQMGLVAAPIHIGPGAWVAAGAFVGPGITVGEGAVVGARSVVTKDVPPWVVVAGNPARHIKDRVLRDPAST